MKFHIEQIALALNPATRGKAMTLLHDLGFEKWDWIEDTAIADGQVLQGANLVRNHANLKFAYSPVGSDGNIELELINYPSMMESENQNWLQYQKKPCVSHLACHVATEEELSQYRLIFDKHDIHIVQEVRTAYHSNPYLKEKGANLSLCYLRHTTVARHGFKIHPPNRGRMNVLCIDFETTGLTKHPSAKSELQPRATEFAAAMIDFEGNVTERVSTLINPGIHIPKETVAINGIDDLKVRDAPRFTDIAADINKALSEADMLVSHNLPFDLFLLSHEIRMARLESTSSAQYPGNDFLLPPRLLCTAQEFKQVLGYRPKMKDLFEMLTGKPYKQTHRAMDDCLVLIEIVMHEKLHEIPAAASKNRAFIPPEFCADTPPHRLLFEE